MRVRWVSNGFGEDVIATILAKALKMDPHIMIGMPLVGTGEAYKRAGIAVGLSPKPVLPSGGFLRRFWDVWRDLRAGLLGQLRYNYRVLRDSPADFQIVVGDVFALVMATFRQPIPTVFFPTAKSERCIPHSMVEYLLMRRYCDLVFPRDRETHERFRTKNLPSHFFGNPMFDGMTADVPPPPNAIGVGILPGSRHEAESNMMLILNAIGQLALPHVVWSAAIPDHIPIQSWDMADAHGWSFVPDSTIPTFVHGPSGQVVTVSSAFYDVLHASRVVIGLAGTANEQALYAKRHVISFIGTGPQSTKQRFREQHQLIEGGQATFIPSSDPQTIAHHIAPLIANPSVPWTPLSDHHQTAATDIATCLQQTFFSTAYYSDSPNEALPLATL